MENLRNFKIIILIIFFITSSCLNKKREKVTSELEKGLIENKTDTNLLKYKSRDSLSKQELLKLYSKSRQSDTLVSYVLYSNSNIKNIDSFVPYYQTYDLNNKKYQNVIRKLFYFDEDIEKVINDIENNKFIVRAKTRQFLLELYNEYSSVEGEDFSYLSSVKDDFIIEISEKMFKNEKANKDELKRMAQEILSDFNDSTYVKRLEK